LCAALSSNFSLLSPTTPEPVVAGTAGEAGFVENVGAVGVAPRQARLVDADSVVAVEDSPEIVDGGAAEPAVVDAVDATPVDAPPVMSAAASGRVSGLGGSVLAWLGGGGNGVRQPGLFGCTNHKTLPMQRLLQRGFQYRLPCRLGLMVGRSAILSGLW
jgi:hypothetical protein